MFNNPHPTTSRNENFQQAIRVYNKLYHSDNLYIIKEGGNSVTIQERKEGEVVKKPIITPSERRRSSCVDNQMILRVQTCDRNLIDALFSSHTAETSVTISEHSQRGWSAHPNMKCVAGRSSAVP